VLETKAPIEEDGIEAAFDVLGEINETVKTGLWVGDCFIYTNSVNRIQYYVGGEIVTVSHLDRTMYLLGYVPKENRLYLGDKELNISSYCLLLSVLEYQTAVMRRDFDIADRVLPTIPKEHRTRVAHFLEKQGFMKQALQVSTDPEHCFDLALKIGDLDKALALARESDSPQKWSQLAEIATSQNKMELVKECLVKANDLGGLLLVASSSGDEGMMNSLKETSLAQGKFNVAFMSMMLLGKLDECLDVLIDTNRIPEAALFARFDHLHFALDA
jgi:coatomer subunit beta'